MFENLFSSTNSIQKTKPKNTGTFSGLFNDEKNKTTPTNQDNKAVLDKYMGKVIDTAKQKATKTIPDHLGGGQYFSVGNTLIKEPRAYGGLSTAKGQERDHIISVSLGGTSNIKNVEYKPSPTDENGKWIYELRQGGKVVLEDKVINDYKAGKISLGEARLKLLTKNQEIKGLIPKQGTKSYLLEGVKEIGKDVGGFFKGLFTKKEPLRGEVGEGLTEQEKQKAKEVVSYEPEVPVAKKSKLDFLSLTEEDFDEEQLSKLNTGQIAISNYGDIAFINDRGEIQAMDAIGGVGFLGEAKTSIKNFAKALSKVDDVAEVGNTLRKMGATDDLVEIYAPKIAKTKNVDEVEKGLKSLDDTFKNTAPKTTAQETDPKFKDLFKSDKARTQDYLDNQRDYVVKELEQLPKKVETKIDDFAEINELVDEMKLEKKPNTETINQGLEILKRYGQDAETLGFKKILSNEAGFAKIPNFMDVEAVKSLAPIKQQDKVVKKIFKNWNRELLTGEQKANELISKIPKVNDNFDTILKYQAGENTKTTKIIKREFDKLFKEAEKAGLDIKYRENYVPQVYQNTTEEVQKAMAEYMKSKGVAKDLVDEYVRNIKELPEAVSNRLKISPYFSKERAFPDYKTAMEFGLTPKYKEPAQLLSHYKLELEKTLANKKFIDSLVRSGRIKDVMKADSNWQAVNLPFSPKGYYAEPKLAKMLNGIFRNEEMLGTTQKAIKGFAGLSKAMQEVVLSAGIPKTNINFFAIGVGLVKELTAGNFKSAIKFIKSNFNKATIKHFAKNKEYLTMMARQGIDLSNTIASHKTIYNKIGDIKDFSKKVGFVWDKTFQEKTFNNLLPMNYLDTFKDTYKKALKKMSPEQAEKLAGDTVRAYHGIYENVGRGKGTEDVLSAVFFAPKFREGIINTLWNTAKSVSTEIFNPAFRKNRKLLAGMIITYGGYNALNKKLSGHYMKDNPPGKEFELMIPTKMGATEDDVVYVPFMPSFLAFPRMLVSGSIATVKGDVKTAVQKFGGLFSMPLKLLSELWANKDYFGREIYDPAGDKKTQLKQMSGYVFGINEKGASGGINHPFIRETYNQIFTDKPLYQSVSEAMEMPLKFSTMTNIQKAELYRAIEEQQKKDKKIKEDFKPKYEEVKKLLDQGDIEKATELTEAMTPDEYKIYQSLKRSDKSRELIDMEVKTYPKYKEVQELLQNGNVEEATEITQSMKADEYSAYKRLKNKLQ